MELVSNMSTEPVQLEVLKPRVALALSGGGFRASIFHLGVLKRLAELGWLSRNAGRPRHPGSCCPIMIGSPPKMRIQQNMGRITFFYHASAEFHLPISVTFSTPTPVLIVMDVVSPMRFDLVG
jgi:hypothetical protein